MKKLTQLLKESQHLDYRRMNVGEEDGQGMTKEEKRAFVEAVAAYRQLGEMISHKGNISEIHDSIKGIVENANNLTLKETGDWFDRVTVQRHMKSMNESFKVFSNTIKEVSTLQQRLESSYDEIGEVLGKYYEIKEGNEFGAERAKAIAAGNDSFEVDGKSYKVSGVDAEDKKNAEEFANESMKLTSLIKRNEELTGKQKELDVDSDGDIEADDLADLRAGKKADESVNEGRKSKDSSGVRYVNAIYNNTNAIVKLVMDEKKDPKEVVDTMGPVLINAIKATLAHNYKPNSQPAYTLKRDLQRLGDLSNQQRIDVFKKGLKELLAVATELVKRPSQVGVKKLEERFRKLWNNEYGANIGLNGQGPHENTIIESVNEAKFKVLASFGGYDLIEAPTEKDMIISKNGKKVGKLTKISKYLKDDIKSFINMVKSGKLGESVNESQFKVGDNVIVTRKDGKEYTGKVEKLNPLKLRTSPSDTMVIPNAYIKDIVVKESVNEGVSPADMDKIKGAVEAASSFMSVGSELKKLGMKYTFATEPLPIYIIQPTPNNKVAVVNKKYATKPDFVVGDIAVGIMEGKLNEEEIKWDAVQNAIINFLKMNTKILDKRVQAKDTNGVKGGLKSIISGLTNAQRNLKLESVNEENELPKVTVPASVKAKLDMAIDKIKDTKLSYNQKLNVVVSVMDSLGIDKSEFGKMASKLKGSMEEISVNEAGYTVKAENPYQFLNGVVAVLSAYLRDEKLGPKGKRELQNILKSLEYMRMYFYANMSESVNERIVKEKVK